MDVLVLTLAGSRSGFRNGKGIDAEFARPSGVTVDDKGNVFVSDWSNHRIRMITPAGVVSTLAGSGQQGLVGGRSTEARFNCPAGVAVDVEGNIVVADFGNNLIRMVTRLGTVETVAGSGQCDYKDGVRWEACFDSPSGVVLDGEGNIIVVDRKNHRIRKIDSQGVVSTLAGSGKAEYADGQGVLASFNRPAGAALDQDGNLIVADVYNNRIRKITPGGLVSTVAGCGQAGFRDGGALQACFMVPEGVAVDREGSIFIADRANNRIRKISLQGVVSTVAGCGQKDFKDGHALVACFNQPSAIGVDPNGNLIVADGENHRIRKITFPAGRSYESPSVPVKIHTEAKAVEDTKDFISRDLETKSSAPTSAETVPMVVPKPSVAVPKTKPLSESGYDMPWIESIPEDYYCPICLHVVRDAVAHTCGKLFCQGCWKHWLAREGYEGKCCCCKQEGNVFPSLRDQKIISNLKIECPECRKEIRLGDYEEKHSRKECIYRVVACENCFEHIFFSDLNEHHEKNCIFRHIICVECNEKVPCQELTTHLENVCENRPLPCSLCKELVKKIDYAKHLEKSMSTHFALLLTQQQLEKENSVRLTNEITHLKQQVLSLQTEVSVLREDHDRLESKLTRHGAFQRAILCDY